MQTKHDPSAGVCDLSTLDTSIAKKGKGIMLRNRISAFLPAFAVVLLMSFPLTSVSAAEVISSGSFVGASSHITEGDVTIVKTANSTLIILDKNFSLDGAPDPKVGLGTNGKYDAKTQAGDLKDLTGLQVYELPRSVDASSYNEVYIWCEKYSVPLGVASLK